LLELALEALEQGEGVRRRAGETADHAALGQAAHFLRIALHHGLAEADLSVAADDDAAASADHEDGGGMHAGGGVFGHGGRTPASGKNVIGQGAVFRPDLIIDRPKATRVAFLAAACWRIGPRFCVRCSAFPMSTSLGKPDPLFRTMC
jgi:hypothetical protein